MEWISVKDRLPDNGTVLVTDGKIVVTAPSSTVTVDGPAISHWMPLPEHRGKLSKETKNKYIRAIKFLRWGQQTENDEL